MFISLQIKSAIAFPVCNETPYVNKAFHQNESKQSAVMQGLHKCQVSVVPPSFSEVLADFLTYMQSWPNSGLIRQKYLHLYHVA